MDEVQPGMVLGRPIYDTSLRTILSEGIELTQVSINRLKQRGYAGIYIDDEWSKEINIEDIISTELRSHVAMSLQELDIDATMNVAKKIVDEILEAEVISLELIDLRDYDEYIYRHSVNVAVLSTVIGIGVGYQGNELLDLSLAAIFHDFGKILITPRILNKPGKLNEVENKVIRYHPKAAYDMLHDKWSIPERVKAGVLYHHENEDGSGYPNGLLGEEIHPFAKIIHVADVYDALSSKRPYKEAYSYSESFEYLLGGCGTLFDKEIVESFAKYVSVYPKGITVELSDGRQALVIENYKSNRLRPKVKLLDGTILDLQDDNRNRNITILGQAGLKSMELEKIEENEKARNQCLPHILVVDDMVSRQYQIKEILKDRYNVSLVKSGKQVLEFLEKKKPDLILMDIAMPNQNGIKTAQEIRNFFPEQIPVIFISALRDVQTVLECRDVQAADYILKPFQPSYLRERIRIVLGEQRT